MLKLVNKAQNDNGFQTVTLRDEQGEPFVLIDAPIFENDEELLAYCEGVFGRLNKPSC